MRVVTFLATGLIVMMALGGCGQKGPLYIEHQDGLARSALEAVDSGAGSSDTRNTKDAGE